MLQYSWVEAPGLSESSRVLLVTDGRSFGNLVHLHHVKGHTGLIFGQDSPKITACWMKMELPAAIGALTTSDAEAAKDVERGSRFKG